jgi:hypothetical protein
MKLPTLLQRSLLCFTACAICAQVYATDLFDPTVSTSNTINATAVRLDATIFASNATAPFIINLYAERGECLRVDVTTQPADLEMVVVAPEGGVYRNDDRVGDTKPLVQVASAPVTGWYTVHLSHFSGATIEGDLTFMYGRYSAGNANCAQATTPLSLQSASISAMFEEENAAILKQQNESAKPLLNPSTQQKPR